MKKYSIIIFLITGIFGNSQNTYVDPTTTLALKLYSDNLTQEQEKTIEQQNRLQKSQAWVASQMVIANNIQNKILKGLQEVSVTVSNGMQIKQIYEDLVDCHQYAKDVANIVQNQPQYSVFGIKASQRVYTRIIKIEKDVVDILQTGELNLATAGDRYKLLAVISDNIQSLKISILSVKLSLESSIRLGFWKSLNPFQGYVNTDKEIVRDIMDRYKNNF